MKIKQIGEYTGNIIQTIINNRNIENVDLFLNPTDENNLDAFKLQNMMQGVEVLLAHLTVDSEMGILVDPDADGFSSSSIIYQYIKKIKPDAKLSYFLHDNKAHGLSEKILEKVSNTSLDLLIIPDAGSNDEDGIARLYHMGIDLLIIDHHEVEQIPNYGILINNQLDTNEETNKNLVGAGMSFKFCEALDKVLSFNHAEGLYDLVAIGQVGDSSDISQNEVRNMIFKGLRSLNNKFVRIALEDHFDSLDNIAPKELSFSIIPLINAVVRVGTMEEKDYLFRALNSIDADGSFTVTKKKKNRDTGKFDKYEIVQNFYEYVYDICKKVKGRQAALVKKTMADLERDVDNSGGVAIGILETSEHGSITGLIANKIASKLQKPVLLVHYIEEKQPPVPEGQIAPKPKGKYVGSGRGYEKVLPSLKDWCNETKLVEFAQGHGNAFGISIFEKDFEAFKEKTKEVEIHEFIYEVDLIVEATPDKQVILDIEDNKYLFGGKVHDPLLAYVGIKVNKNFIRQRGSMLTFFDRGVEFIMYGAPEGLFEKLTHNFDPFITMDFVGRPSVNKYGGKVTPQLVLADCERNEEIRTPDKSKELEITPENLVF